MIRFHEGIIASFLQCIDIVELIINDNHSDSPDQIYETIFSHFVVPVTRCF